MFDTLQDRLAATFKSLRGKGRLSEADIDATAREIRIALLEADVNLSVVKDFVAAVKQRAREAELSGALNPAQQVIKIVNEELVHILGGETRLLRFAKRPPTVIMLAGLQGSGKTTLAGKLALWLRQQGHSPLLVAADLQRPNAVNQLQVIGQRAGIHVYAPEPGNASSSDLDRPSGDPVQVARSSIAEAERRLYDVVIVDTAGRLGIDAELMQQAADIRDAVHPDEVLFVVDAMIGQDAVNTANAFAEGVGFDGVVLTKLDGDARGGAALSIARVTGRPIMFASNGEALTDFDVFHPDRMASRILGMGDMLTLIEQAERTFDAEESAKAAAKLAGKGGEIRAGGLPQADADGPQDGTAVQDLRHAARDGRDQGPDQQHRREGGRPDRGDHPLDDPCGARQPQDHRRLPAGSDRQGRRGRGLRCQRPGQPVLRRPQDDELAGRRQDASDTGDAGDADGARRQPPPSRQAEEEGRPGCLRQPCQAQRTPATQPGRSRPGSRVRRGTSSTRLPCRRPWRTSSSRPSCAAASAADGPRLTAPPERGGAAGR